MISSTYKRKNTLAISSIREQQRPNRNITSLEIIPMNTGCRRWLNKHCCICLAKKCQPGTRGHAVIQTPTALNLLAAMAMQNHTHTIHVWSNVPIHLTMHGWYGIKCHSVPHLFHPREGWWFPIPRNMRVGNADSHYKDST